MTESLKTYTHGQTIRTARLLLRDNQPTDAKAFNRIRCNPANLKYVPFGAESLDATSKWIQARLTQPNSFNFTIELLPSEAELFENKDDPSEPIIIGMCGGIRTPEFGYMVDSPYSGRGYATEAMRAAIESFWKTFPDGMPCVPEDQKDFISANIVKGHVASAAVVRKLGFQKIGEFEEEAVTGGEKGLVVLERWKLERPC